MTLVICLVFLVVHCNLLKAEDPKWHLIHQSDYDVKPERAEIMSYNYSYFNNLKMKVVFYNRTCEALNLSTDLLLDLTNNMTAYIQVYKFLSNEYRFFPVTFSVAICKEYDLDSFGIKTLLDRTSNIPSCMMKKGFYYIKNAVPDFSRWPPYLPRGAYKLEIKTNHNSDFLWELHGYVSIVDKPYHWID